MIDDRTLFFGFSCQCNLELSPLIADKEIMASYAAQYMMQTDGKHDRAYWLSITGDGVESSDLADAESCVFKTAQLEQIPKRLQQTAIQNTPDPELYIEYHLQFLLAAAAEVDANCLLDSEAAARLGFDEGSNVYEEIDGVISIVQGKKALPKGATYRDAGIFVREYLDLLVENLVGNWQNYFSMLASTQE